jgi:hypothetical protein
MAIEHFTFEDLPIPGLPYLPEYVQEYERPQVDVERRGERRWLDAIIIFITDTLDAERDPNPSAFSAPKENMVPVFIFIVASLAGKVVNYVLGEEVAPCT